MKESEFAVAADQALPLTDASPRPLSTSAGAKLRGRMGVSEVALSVVAFASPLTTAWGYLPFVIYFAGLGAPLTFLVATAILLVFSVGYVRMSRFSPTPGAFYSIIATGLNKPLGLGAAFLAALGYLLIGTGVYTFFGIVSTDLIASFGGPEIAWYWGTLLCIAVVALFGYVGVEFAAKTLVFLMIIEVAVVVIFDIAVAVQGGADGLSAEPFSIGTFFEGQVGLGIMYAMVMFIGFEASAIYREEARDPEKTIPRATYISVLFIGLFNAVAVWAVIMSVGPDNAVQAATDDPAGMFPGGYVDFIGSTAKDVASVLVITAVFASCLSTHNVFTRYLYNLGVDRALPASLGKAHPEQRSPYIASVTATCISTVFVLGVIISRGDPSAYYGSVAGIGSLSVLFIMLLASIAVPLYFRNHKTSGGNRLWAEKIAPLLAALGLGAIVAMALANANDFLVATTGMSIFFIACIVSVFLAGVVIALVLKTRRPESFARIGRQAD